MEQKYCPFCDSVDIVMQNKLVFAIYDRFPVNEGHMLIIPFRHVIDYWSSSTEERQAIDELLEECKTLLDERFKPDAYNIGVNCG